MVRWTRRPGWAARARRRATVTSGWRSSHSHEAPERRRRVVAQHRARPAGLDRGEEAALERQVGVADRVDAAVDRVQAAVAHAGQTRRCATGHTQTAHRGRGRPTGRRRPARRPHRDACRVSCRYGTQTRHSLLGARASPTVAPRVTEQRADVTTLRSAAGTYAAFDAPRPHCRSKRRDDRERSGPAARALGAEATRFAVPLAHPGPRPAGSPAERRAHQRVAARFRAAGLRSGFERFAVPGKGTSRDVIAIRDVPARCLVIAMAHADSVPPAPGADDNASGVGTLVALAPALAAAAGAGVRHVARGDRLRGAPLHRAARPPRRCARSCAACSRTAPPRRRPPRAVPRRGRARHALRAALARRRARARHVETPILDAARARQRRRHLAARQRDGQLRPPRARARRGARGEARRPRRAAAATPRSDTPDRLQRGAFARVLRVVWPLLREVS